MPSLNDFLRQFSFTLAVSELPVWWQNNLIQVILKNYFDIWQQRKGIGVYPYVTASGGQWGSKSAVESLPIDGPVF